MAVPKRRVSKSKTSSRKSANMKLNPPALVACSSCGALIRPHRACPECGMYKGNQIVAVDKA